MKKQTAQLEKKLKAKKEEEIQSNCQLLMETSKIQKE